MAQNITFKANDGEYKIYSINNRDTRLREFNDIKTKEDAYFIGYMLGDGCFEKGGSNRTPRMTLISKDKYIIEYFKNKYQPDSKIYSRIPINNVRPEILSTEESHRIGFSSYYSDTFEKYGILAHKEDRKIKNIPSEFMKHYILGFLDADGSISYHTQETNGRFRVGVKFTHPSENVLKTIKDYLYETIGLGGSISDKKGEKCKYLSISGLLDVVKFVDWIYSDVPEIYNTRKYNVALNLKSEFITRYFSVKKDIIGIRKNKKSYTPFIVLNKQDIKLKNTKDYDEAVCLRICEVAKNIDKINKNSWYYFNPLSNTFQITYINPQDNLPTYLEVSLQGEILQFTKL
jgi:hypothetical protein